jgi:hypothetical protein
MKIMKELEKLCYDVKTTENYQKGSFDLDWCFCIGYLCNAIGSNHFETPHPIPERSQIYGVCLTDPLMRKYLPVWKKKLYLKARDLIALYVPDLLLKTYAVQFSKIGNSSCFLKFHQDLRDVSSQYAVYLGDYEGAYLEVCDPNGDVFEQYSSPYVFLHFDGRLWHRVSLNNFSGTRFAIIFFQQFDMTKTKEDPIVFPPHYLS